MNHLRWSSGMRSHQGNVRERNEDAALDSSELGIWVVADGMGGHSRGDFASALLIEHVSQFIQGESLDKVVFQIVDLVEQTNGQLIELGKEGSLSGTTLAVLVVCEGKAACVWVGDSRVYRYRDGCMEQLTEDHTEVKNGHVLTRAIGADESLEVDVRGISVISGDQFVLCSDGLYEELSSDQMEHTLSLSNSPQQAANRLVELSLDGSCNDNVTAVVVEFEGWN